MGRAFLLLGLLTTAAAGQFDSGFNPYNPYVNLSNRGSIQFRSYSSLNRWNLERQSASPPHSELGAVVNRSIASSNNWAAGFQYLPHYPRRTSALDRGSSNGPPIFGRRRVSGLSGQCLQVERE